MPTPVTSVRPFQFCISSQAVILERVKVSRVIDGTVQ